MKPSRPSLSINYADQIDWPETDDYIELDLFFENVGATGFDGMTDVWPARRGPGNLVKLSGNIRSADDYSYALAA